MIFAAQVLDFLLEFDGGGRALVGGVFRGLLELLAQCGVGGDLVLEVLGGGYCQQLNCVA